MWWIARYYSKLLIHSSSYLNLAIIIIITLHRCHCVGKVSVVGWSFEYQIIIIIVILATSTTWHHTIPYHIISYIILYSIFSSHLTYFYFHLTYLSHLSIPVYLKCISISRFSLSSSSPPCDAPRQRSSPRTNSPALTNPLVATPYQAYWIYSTRKTIPLLMLLLTDM